MKCYSTFINFKKVKHYFTRIASFFLAVIILFSTSSFTVDMHFCCNKLVDISIIGKAKACNDSIQNQEKPVKHCTQQQEKECCSNQIIVKNGDDVFKESKTILKNEIPVFLNTFYYTQINLFEGLEKNVISFQTYRPPPLSIDIIILYETFLI